MAGADLEPELAPETVSRHQVAAMSRILGLNPDNTVALTVQLGHVDVTLYDPPADARHPLLRTVRYMVET